MFVCVCVCLCLSVLMLRMFFFSDNSNSSLYYWNYASQFKFPKKIMQVRGAWHRNSSPLQTQQWRAPPATFLVPKSFCSSSKQGISRNWRKARASMSITGGSIMMTGLALNASIQVRVRRMLSPIFSVFRLCFWSVSWPVGSSLQRQPFFRTFEISLIASTNREKWLR